MIGTIVSLLSLVYAVQGFPNGAPRMVCNSMTPFHAGFSAQNSASPFFLVVNTQSVSSLRASDIGPDGEVPDTKAVLSVTVTLNSEEGHDFRGYLLQARPESGAESIGTFRILDGSVGKLIDCSGGSENTVTHSSRQKKDSESFQWIPPLDFQGKVVFRATVVEGFRTFWTGVESVPVSVEIAQL